MNSNDFLNEGIGEDAQAMALDHEVQMARQECYHAAEDAITLHKLLRHMSEQQGLEGWVSAKITLAADYLNTVREHLEYQLMSGAEAQQPMNVVTVAEGTITQEDLAPVTDESATGLGNKRDRFKSLRKKSERKAKFGLSEVNPHNFDSDEDYYAAQNAPAKRRSAPSDYPYSPEEDDAYFNNIFRKKREAAKKAAQDKESGVSEGSLNEFAPGNGGGESGRWYTDDDMTDIVGDGWWQDLDISGDVSKQEMMNEAQGWLLDQGYRVRVLNVRVNDDDCNWFIEGSFQNPRFAKKGVAEGLQPDSDIAVLGVKILTALKQKCEEIDRDYPEMWETFTDDDWIQSGRSLQFLYDYIQTDKTNIDAFTDAWEDLNTDPLQYWPTEWHNGQWESFIAPWKQYAYEVLKSRGVDPKPPGTVHEGVAETLPMRDAVKVLRQYGADHFKTTSNELHFYKNGKGLSVDLVMNSDATRSVTLSSLNSATRSLKGQGVAEGYSDMMAKERRKRLADAEKKKQERLAAEKAKKDKKQQGVAEGEEMGTFAALKDWQVWDVHVFNNFYRGKYADYGPRLYSVVAGSPEEARQVIINNADYVLQDLLSRKLQNGKKVLPRGSALPIEDKRVGKAQPGTITTMGLKKMLTPDGVQSFKFTGGKIVDGSHAAGGEEVAEDEAKLKAYKRASAGDAINRQNIARHTGKADPKIAKRNAGQERAEKRLSGISQGISEMSAGSVAGVVNPTPKNKAKVGSLFGGTYKQKKAAK